MSTTFDVDPSDYLGLQHDSYKNDLLAMSFSAPSKYIALRKAVIKTLKTQFTNEIYGIFFNLLTSGRMKDGRSRYVEIDAIMPDFGPSVPKQVVSEIALGIARDMDEKINEIVNKYIIPIDNLELARKQTQKIEMGVRAST